MSKAVELIEMPPRRGAEVSRERGVANAPSFACVPEQEKTAVSQKAVRVAVCRVAERLQRTPESRFLSASPDLFEGNKVGPPLFDDAGNARQPFAGAGARNSVDVPGQNMDRRRGRRSAAVAAAAGEENGDYGADCGSCCLLQYHGRTTLVA